MEHSVEQKKANIASHWNASSKLQMYGDDNINKSLFLPLISTS
jgi:hypothetical protein